MPDANTWAQTWLKQHQDNASQDDALPSEDATNASYDPVTAHLINDTPGLNEVSDAIASTPRINPLAVMRGQQMGPEMLPTAIMKAQRAASVKERAQVQALLQDADMHEMRKAELATHEARLTFDMMREAAKQGSAAMGSIYKTYLDLAKDMDPARANEWLGAIMKSDISQGVPDEASGQGLALQALQSVGGVKAKPPSGPAPLHTFTRGNETYMGQWTGQKWQELPNTRSPKWKNFSVAGQDVSPELEPVAQNLLDEGLRPNAVAGIIANLQHESGGNPLAVGDSGTSVGLAQWNKSRASALFDYAKRMKLDPRSPQTQTSFLKEELLADPDLLEEMNKAPTARAAANIFQRKYERPAEFNPGRGTTAQGSAAAMVKKLGGGGMPSVKTDADYHALPSGTEFRDPDGRVHRKP